MTKQESHLLPEVKIKGMTNPNTTTAGVMVGVVAAVMAGVLAGVVVGGRAGLVCRTRLEVSPAGTVCRPAPSYRCST